VLDANSVKPDFDDGAKTENTRSAYPLEFIPMPRVLAAPVIRKIW